MDTLSVMTEYLDSRDCSRLAACSRILRKKLYSITHVREKIRCHIVAVQDMDAFDRLVSHGHAFKCDPDASVWMDNVLWYQFGVNAHDLNINSCEDMILYTGGEGTRYYQDLVTHDIVHCSNFYAPDLSHCSTYDDSDSRTKRIHTCGDLEHVADQFDNIERHFPGLIKTWMYILFPFQRGERHNLVRGDWGFHRGVCVYIRVNSFGIEDVQSIRKYLDKMKKNQPPTCATVGRAKRRRTIPMPTPPQHPFLVERNAYKKRHGPIIGTEYRRKFMKHYK